MNNKLKTRIASVGIAVLAFTGLGAMATPASAYSVQGCNSPQNVYHNGYWRTMHQYCYVDYNWYEETFNGSRDGYKLTYSWTENTLSGAKQNFRTHDIRR